MTQPKKPADPRMSKPGAVPPIPHEADALVDHDPKDADIGPRPPATPATPVSTRYDVGSNGGGQPDTAFEDDDEHD